MDTSKIVIRNIIRVLGIIAGAVAGFASLILKRLNNVDDPNTLYILCTVARIGAIALFVCAVAFVIYDVILKAYPLSIGAIGLVLGAVAFVGSFLIAPVCSEEALNSWLSNHASSASSVENLATQVSIGTWMIAAGGIFYASYQGGCMKQGK